MFEDKLLIGDMIAVIHEYRREVTCPYTVII